MSESTKDMPKISSGMEAPKALNYIEKLVAELCPGGVEYVELNKLLKYEQPGKYTVSSTNYDDSYSTPVLTAGKTFILGYTDEEDGIYAASKKDPVIIFDDFTTAFKWVDFNFKIKSTAIKLLTSYDSNTSLKYIYYAMQCIKYETQDHARQWISNYSKFLIPLPPVEVQNAIVEILDKFTKLEAELEAELAARRAQYEYYRNSLFENLSGGGSEILGNLVKIKNGKSYKGFNSGDIPVYGSGGIMTYVDRSAYSGPSVLIPRKGSLGNIFYVDTPFWNVDTIFYTEINREQVTPKYLYHALQVQNLSGLNTAGGVPSLTQTVLKRVRIPLPSLAEQERIVKILDKFDALVNDISSGLPAEIEARRKQYEYYRDRLLTFPRKFEPAEQAMQR
jgi:restriction endonuclease S subunit